MQNSFHGRTLATLSASGSDRLQTGFEPLVPGFIRVPFNDIPAIAELAQTNHNIVAILVEPIQGEGGIFVPDEDYLGKVRTLCDQHDLLMIIDEVQTGIGRTGKWFAYQHSNILPDVVTVAKALGNGVPIGACLARGKSCNLFAPGNHVSTFGGNPLACSAALAVLQTMETENLVQNAEKMGVYLQHKLKETLHDIKSVVAVRGKGLMIGVELDRPCRDLTAIGAKHSLLFNVTADKVVRLLPPLIITETDADQIAARLKTAIEDFLQI
jgi:acetylornithine aminotransferase